MRTLSSTSEADPQATEAGQNSPQRVPEQLRFQGLLASVLLIISWIIPSLVVLAFSPHRALTVATLLPGLLVAGYLVIALTSSLSQNHRDEQEDFIFSTLGAGNWITVIRGAMVVGLCSLLPLTLNGSQQVSINLGWFGATLYLIISLTDLLDGYAARKQNRVTQLGKSLDMETDAVGLLVASSLALLLGRLPVLYILVGLAYYLFIAGLWWRKRQGLAVVPLEYRPYGRIIAGCQMGLVALVLFPFFSSTYTHIGASLFMLPFLIGFIRDWLVVSCRIRTDANQRTRFDMVWNESIQRYLSILARLLVAIFGLYLYQSGQLSSGDRVWMLGMVISMVMIVIGILGRTAALLLLLLLGLTLSPVGTSLPAMVTFCCATTLFLIGNGPYSLWSPEENILYRRGENADETTRLR